MFDSTRTVVNSTVPTPGPGPSGPAPKVILHRGEAREYITARVQERIRQRRQQEPHI
ncbi:MAG: hypothetical protein ACYC3I_16615 [Gemmataceae bacterium]